MEVWPAFKVPAKMEVFLSARPEYAGASSGDRERAFELWQESKKKEDWKANALWL